MLTALVLGTTFSAGPAFACREVQIPTALPSYPTVLIVRVKSSDFVGDQSHFFQWAAKAQLISAVAGTTTQKEINFRGAFQSSGCRAKRAPPPPGELWALFYDNLGELAEALPIVVAQPLDRRIDAVGLD